LTSRPGKGYNELGIVHNIGLLWIQIKLVELCIIEVPQKWTRYKSVLVAHWYRNLYSVEYQYKVYD